MLSELPRILGPMRLLLYATVAAFLPMVLGADAEPEGMGVLTAYIAPSLIVLFVFVLLLDALMNRVFMIEKEIEEKRPFRLRMRSDLLAVAAILVIWGPWFYQLVAYYSD